MNAAVHGVCYTGGLELALACDFILADATARFADTRGKWGLVGAWGMSQQLPRRIGVQAAKRMMMTAEPVEGSEANNWHTNFAIKRLMRETDGMSLAEALAYEHFRYPGYAPDYQERISRFGKKSQ